LAGRGSGEGCEESVAPDVRCPQILPFNVAQGKRPGKKKPGLGMTGLKVLLHTYRIIFL
jgi:hypothetical protein